MFAAPAHLSPTDRCSAIPQKRRRKTVILQLFFTTVVALKTFVPAAAAPILGSSAMVAALSPPQQVKGVAVLVHEDHLEARQHYVYGLLAVTDAPSEPSLVGSTLFLDVTPGTSPYQTSGAVIDLTIRERAVLSGPSTSADRPGAGVFPKAAEALQPERTPLLGFPGRRLFAVKPTVPPTADPGNGSGGGGRARRGYAAPSSRSASIIVVNFADAAPDCDAACARNMMWGTSGSTEHVAGLFKEASHSQITFPASKGEVHTVSVATKTSDLVGCPYWEVAALADAAMQAEHGVNTGDKNHQIYIIPDALSCGWEGLGYIGCAASNNCKVFLRKGVADGGKQTLAHELGHNLGQHHAAVDMDDDGAVEDDYGDASCIMGIASYWRSFNTPHRIKAGWIQEDDIVDLVRPSAAACKANKDTAGKTVLRLTSLHAEPQGESGAVAAARIPRNGGGTYYVGYRGRQGYDASLPITSGDRVHLHYALEGAAASQEESSSRLVAMVGKGSGNVAFRAGFALEVTAVTGAVASLTVDLCAEPPAQSGGGGEGTLGKCSGVTVSGREGTNARELNGNYMPNGEHDGRAAYLNPNMQTHLYWIARHSVWAFGSVLGSDTMFTYLMQDISPPVNPSVNPFVYTSVGWIEDPKMELQCYGGPTTAAPSSTAGAVASTSPTYTSSSSSSYTSSAPDGSWYGGSSSSATYSTSSYTTSTYSTRTSTTMPWLTTTPEPSTIFSDGAEDDDDAAAAAAAAAAAMEAAETETSGDANKGDEKEGGLAVLNGVLAVVAVVLVLVLLVPYAIRKQPENVLATAKEDRRESARVKRASLAIATGGAAADALLAGTRTVNSKRMPHQNQMSRMPSYTASVVSVMGSIPDDEMVAVTDPFDGGNPRKPRRGPHTSHLGRMFGAIGRRPASKLSVESLESSTDASMRVRHGANGRPASTTVAERTRNPNAGQPRDSNMSTMSTYMGQLAEITMGSMELSQHHQTEYADVLSEYTASTAFANVAGDVVPIAGSAPTHSMGISGSAFNPKHKDTHLRIAVGGGESKEYMESGPLLPSSRNSTKQGVRFSTDIVLDHEGDALAALPVMPPPRNKMKTLRPPRVTFTAPAVDAGVTIEAPKSSNFKRLANGRLSMKDQGLPPPAFVAPPTFDQNDAAVRAQAQPQRAAVGFTEPEAEPDREQQEQSANFKRMARGRLSMKDQGLPPPAFVAPPTFDQKQPASPPPFSPPPMPQVFSVDDNQQQQSPPTPTNLGGPRSVMSLIRGFQLA